MNLHQRFLKSKVKNGMRQNRSSQRVNTSVGHSSIHYIHTFSIPLLQFHSVSPADPLLWIVYAWAVQRSAFPYGPTFLSRYCTTLVQPSLPCESLTRPDSICTNNWSLYQYVCLTTNTRFPDDI